MRDSIIFYRSFYEAINELPPDVQAKVYSAIFEYSLNFNEVVLEGLPKTIFTLIKPQLDANNKRFENGKKGGRKKSEENQEETKTEPKTNQEKNETEPNNNVNVNVNVNENVNNNDILLEKETKEENLSKENPIEIFPQSESVEPGAEERKKVAQKKERFKPPTVQEVQDYCNERQNGIQAYTFVNFYQSKGWKVGNQPMKDWKAAVRTWEQTNKQNGITNTTNTGFSNKGSVSNGKIQGRSIVADRISQHLARNSDSGNHTIDIEAKIV